MNRRQWLRLRSHDSNFLWKWTLGMLAVGGFIGCLAQLTLSTRSPQLDQLQYAAIFHSTNSGIEAFRSFLATPLVSFAQKLAGIASIGQLLSQADDVFAQREQMDPQDARQVIAETNFSANDVETALALFDSCLAGRIETDLRTWADVSPPKQYANHALGCYWSEMDDPLAAAKRFEIEGEFPQAKESRQAAVDHYRYADDFASIARLAEMPSYRGLIQAGERAGIAASRRDWWQVWWLQPSAEWERLSPAPVVMSLLTGLCWLTIALQAGQFTCQQGVRWGLCVVAVLLGIVSIWPTMFLIHWQEELWGIRRSQDLIEGIKYYVMGVGLREEISKLVLYLPLLPFVVRRRSELEALIVPACVGLGFAVLENQSYFSSTTGVGTVTRFLTANFFHMVLTGISGLYLTRALWYGGTRYLDAAAMFIVAVFAHGMYDAVLSIPFFRDYSFAYLVIYILLAYLFFHELRSHRSNHPETISLTATFLTCLALLLSAGFSMLAVRYGITVAARLIVPEALETATIAYMFLREIPNSLIGR